MNPNCEETYAILRVVGANVDPDTLTSLSGIVPTQRAVAGEPNAGGQSRREGIWAISTEGNSTSTDLEDHLGMLLDRLTCNFNAYVPEGARFEIHCVWWSATGHGGPVISATLLNRIAAVGLDLSFDFYSSV